MFGYHATIEKVSTTNTNHHTLSYVIITLKIAIILYNVKDANKEKIQDNYLKI
jgi:hypothetical protein